MPLRSLSLLALLSAPLAAQVVGVQGVIYYGRGDEIAAITPAPGGLAIVSGAASSLDCDSTDDGGAFFAACIYVGGWAPLLSPSFGSGATNITGITDDLPPGEPSGLNEFAWYVDRSTGDMCVHVNGSGQPACRGKVSPWTPSAATDACMPNRIGHDDDYIYVCIASGDIRRTAIATW